MPAGTAGIAAAACVSLATEPFGCGLFFTGTPCLPLAGGASGIPSCLAGAEVGRCLGGGGNLGTGGFIFLLGGSPVLSLAGGLGGTGNMCGGGGQSG